MSFLLHKHSWVCHFHSVHSNLKPKEEFHAVHIEAPEISMYKTTMPCGYDFELKTITKI